VVSGLQCRIRPLSIVPVVPNNDLGFTTNDLGWRHHRLGRRLMAQVVLRALPCYRSSLAAVKGVPSVKGGPVRAAGESRKLGLFSLALDLTRSVASAFESHFSGTLAKRTRAIESTHRASRLLPRRS